MSASHQKRMLMAYEGTQADSGEDRWSTKDFGSIVTLFSF